MKRTLQLFTVAILLCLCQHSSAQTDTAKLKREQQQKMQQVKEAQQKAFDVYKKMGIEVDPNKKMTKEEAQKLKEKLLKQTEQMKRKMPVQMQGGKITYEHKNIDISKIPTGSQVLQIADRFFKRSYKQLTAIQKNQFDLDFKLAEKNKFSLDAVRNLTNKGAELITFGNDHLIACVYLTAAVKSMPGDTLSINNFGGYLRIIDSLTASLPVLLYALQLYPESPVILTQIGCSLLELNDDVKAEKYLKLALKYNPDFGQAGTALCEVYIRQGRFKEALAELFAGIKNMGAGYQQASIANQQIQAGISGGKPDFSSKEEFWNETKRQMQPADGAATQGAGAARVDMPYFPSIDRVEDWTLGGGNMNAVQGFKAFMDYTISFAEQFRRMHEQVPVLPENAVLRDYPNERFAIECILEMFAAYSNEESNRYHKTIEKVTQDVSDAMAAYIKKFTEYIQMHNSCIQQCPQGDTICPKECWRQYCALQCPNANEYNEKLRLAYNNYRMAFSQLTSEQIKLLNDLYAFTDPWLAKIHSSYWSRIYAWEIKRVALGIVGNTYLFYPQPMQIPVNDACGSDCSIYLVPVTANPGEANKKDPNANSCPEGMNFKIPMLICELGLDCESIEFGCAAGLAASVKKNFVKDQTTMFVGVGLKGEAGVLSGKIKAGAVIVVNDKTNEVTDVGGKVEASASAGMGPAKFKASANATYTVMKGLSTNVKAGIR